jgi:hypothetical protein
MSIFQKGITTSSIQSDTDLMIKINNLTLISGTATTTTIGNSTRDVTINGKNFQVTSKSGLVYTGPINCSNLKSNGNVSVTGSIEGDTIKSTGSIAGSSLECSGNVSGLSMTCNGNMNVFGDINTSGSLNCIRGNVLGLTVTSLGNVTGSTLISNGDVKGTSMTCTGTITGNSFVYTGTTTIPDNSNQLVPASWVTTKISGLSSNTGSTINTGSAYTWSALQTFNQGIQCATINSTGTTTLGNTLSAVTVTGTIALNGTTTCNSTLNAVTFNATSDKRLKQKYTELDRESSLCSLRQLKPMRYDFIDAQQSHLDQLGFLAQDIRSIDILSSSVNVSGIGFLPNLGKTVHCNCGFFYLDLDLNLKVSDRVQYKTDETYEFATVVESKNGYIQLDTPITGDIFLYGKEVQDIHSIQKDMIYTLAVSAIQRLDEIVVQQQKTIDSLVKLLQMKDIYKSN